MTISHLKIKLKSMHENNFWHLSTKVIQFSGSFGQKMFNGQFLTKTFKIETLMDKKSYYKVIPLPLQKNKI